jgi:hypothetical protein
MSEVDILERALKLKELLSFDPKLALLLLKVY